jgi:hypothetical protein
MRHKLIIVTLLGFCALLSAETFPVPALPFAPLTYSCYPTTSAITIDGQLDDPAWAGAIWTEEFTDIEGSLKSAPYLDTKVKMLWDEKGFYIAARLDEPHIWGTLTEHDAVIFQDNDFEVFIDPDGDTHQYYELEFNALGTLWDLFLIKPYRDEHSSLNGWEAVGIEYAVGIEGSVNDPTDRDTAWTVEIFLPWSSMEEMAHMPCPPKPGDMWRVNFSRVQWDTEIRDSGYVKVTGRPEHNWVWSPQGLIAMHYPERWGCVIFLGQAPDGIPQNPSVPVTLEAEECLRQLYYAQKQYWLDNGRYTDSLRKLEFKPVLYKRKMPRIKLEGTSQSYRATIEMEDNLILGITEDGRLLRGRR